MEMSYIPQPMSEEIRDKFDQILCLACERDNFDMINFLLTDNDIKNCLAKKNHALKIASYHGKVRLMQLLIDHGADIHYQDDECLVLACARGQIDTLKYFKESGYVHIELREEMLFVACENGHLEIVQYLLGKCKLSVNINHARKLASKNNHSDIVRYLIGYGADVCDDGNDALKWAKYYEDQKLIKYLLDEGADKEIMKEDYWNFGNGWVC